MACSVSNSPLFGAFLCLVALFISSIVIHLTPVYIVTSIALAIFHMIGTKRFSQPRWNFLVGLAYGAMLGPFYLILHLKKEIRVSKSWGDNSDGAKIGMAGLGACLVLFLGGPPQIHLLFAWLYECAIIIIHAIRSLPSDRVRWGYGINGFAAGMLFGPFGIFFKRCFPETMKDKQARGNFHGGFGFGMIFVLTVINLITSFWVSIRHSPD